MQAIHEASSGNPYAARCFAAFALWFCCASSAQASPSLGIVIDELDDQAALCGFEKVDLWEKARSTIGSKGVNMTDADRFWMGFALLRVTIKAKYATPIDVCIVNINVKVQAYATDDRIMNPLYGFAGKSRNTELCESDAVDWFPKTGLGASLDAVESNIKACLDQLTY